MSDQDEPKIIVDEDWKSQVEKEKEELREAEQSSPDEAAEHQMPEASFTMLLATLGTQSMAMLGLMPEPDGGPPQTNLPMAKHVIDLIGMLEEKTKGNLTDEEARMLTDNLHQLRMAYVEVKKRSGQGEAAESSVPNASPSGTIELP